jgi:hypothetical protein
MARYLQAAAGSLAGVEACAPCWWLDLTRGAIHVCDMTDLRTLSLGELSSRWPQAQVGILCNACDREDRFPTQAVITRLDQIGLNGRAFLVSDLANEIKGPCFRCGKLSYSAWADFVAGKTATPAVSPDRAGASLNS